MSKQYHYIAMYDEESNEWSIDFETPLNFDEGHIWDSEKEEWGFTRMEEDGEDEENEIIQDLEERLSGNIGR